MRHSNVQFYLGNFLTGSAGQLLLQALSKSTLLVRDFSERHLKLCEWKDYRFDITERIFTEKLDV